MTEPSGRFTCVKCGHLFDVKDYLDEEALIAHFGYEPNSVVCPRCFSTGLHADAMDRPATPESLP